MEKTTKQGGKKKCKKERRVEGEGRRVDGWMGGWVRTYVGM